VAQIVARHSETAAVFQRHRIDFCCRGDRTLAQACANLGRDPEALIAELERTVRERALEPPEEDLLGLSTPALLERIVERHHGYLRRALPCLEPLLAKVAAVHGEHNPKLLALGRAFTELAGMLGPHLEFEEQALFPELLRLPGPPEGVREDLDDMAREHFGVGTKLAQIRSLADDFTTPAWGCSSYRALMTELQELEADVLQHVHLENHVLMPRFAGREPALS
jgi:regulator of cell morphogenesis and NO signaling